MTSSVDVAESKGNCVAQLIVITAVSSVLCQLYRQPDTGSPSPSITSSLNSTGEDSQCFTLSKVIGFLLFLGLLGLFRHKFEQVKKAGNEADRREIATIVLSHTLRTSDLNASPISVAHLPRDVMHDLLLFLSPKDLVICPMVCQAWDHVAGDNAETLWRRVFQRDFGESGDRFAKVFPIECWRQFYFRHHLSRAVEIARLLSITDGRKCVAIAGQVYDVTEFLEMHPGGPHAIGDAVGTDATIIWDQFQHSDEAKASMEQFLVWDKVLARPESEKLRGNLKSVVAHWRKVSWALTHSHCFGRMAPRLTDSFLRFSSRCRTNNKRKYLGLL